jgi:hypothetical protein
MKILPPITPPLIFLLKVKKIAIEIRTSITCDCTDKNKSGITTVKDFV